MPLQQFSVCHMCYIILGRNRKENPLENCCRKRFLFLALFYLLCFIVAVELNANERNSPIPDTNFVGFNLGIESLSWFPHTHTQRQFASQIIWKSRQSEFCFLDRGAFRLYHISALSHLYILQKLVIKVFLVWDCWCRYDIISLSASFVLLSLKVLAKYFIGSGTSLQFFW